MGFIAEQGAQQLYLTLSLCPAWSTAKTPINALIKLAHKLPKELYKPLTWGRGKEMAHHKRFTLDSDITVYFCDHDSHLCDPKFTTSDIQRHCFATTKTLSMNRFFAIMQIIFAIIGLTHKTEAEPFAMHTF